MIGLRVEKWMKEVGTDRVFICFIKSDIIEWYNNDNEKGGMLWESITGKASRLLR